MFSYWILRPVNAFTSERKGAWKKNNNRERERERGDKPLILKDKDFRPEPSLNSVLSKTITHTCTH